MESLLRIIFIFCISFVPLILSFYKNYFVIIVLNIERFIINNHDN